MKFKDKFTFWDRIRIRVASRIVGDRTWRLMISDKAFFRELERQHERLNCVGYCPKRMNKNFQEEIYPPKEILDRMKVGDETGFSNDHLGGRKHWLIIRKK